MALSKPIYTILGAYLEQLFNHPIRTKSITSAVLATSANYTSQRIAGNKTISQKALLAYGSFGLLFGGTVPHFFYQMVEKIFPHKMPLRKILVFLAERLIFAPFYQALSLYFLSRFEGNTHEHAVQNLTKLYEKLLKTNWIYLSIPVFLNMNYVPPIIRTLTFNMISFVWVIYLAGVRRRFELKKKSDEATTSQGISNNLK
ncbi:peroxisomal membrane protein 2 [Episyrphus balteatus]|uniref:peroxisomal membrane protein 2 n=1 Tax=Episyrphus balteatus TaxID=286459 RepID=UPI0024859C06|nr:peroxisomal membrane protein 2 [Episyrphus balteatus]